MKARRLIALLLSAAAGLLPAAVRGEDVVVTLEERSAYEVDGSFRVPAPQAVAWAVLTDYEHIGDFVPAVKKSWIADRGPDFVLVGQDLSGSLLFFSRRMSLRLRVRETPQEIIDFEDLSGADFTSYAGAWNLKEVDGGTLVTYHLEAAPRFHVPAFIVRSALKRGARNLLSGVRAEMVRRAGGVR